MVWRPDAGAPVKKEDSAHDTTMDHKQLAGAAPTSPQVTTAHALALLPTLYSAYPAAAAAGAGPPGIFSYIAAGLLPPPPTHPFHPLASEVTAARTSAATAAVKRPIAHLATPGLPPLI